MTLTGKRPVFQLEDVFLLFRLGISSLQAADAQLGALVSLLSWLADTSFARTRHNWGFQMAGWWGYHNR